MFEREERGSTNLLWMRHGKANALDLEFLIGLAEELEGEARRPARALVLTGHGSIFSAGVDLVRIRDGGEAYVSSFLPALERALRALFVLEKPVVAAVNGHAIAGGAVLACACDLRVMAEGEGRVGVPELPVGVPFPTLALEIVRRIVPSRHLDETVLTGRTWSAADAHARGWVDELVDARRVLERALERAAELSAAPQRSFALTKRALRRPTLDHCERFGAEHDRAVLEAWTSAEVRSAIAAWVRRTLGK